MLEQEQADIKPLSYDDVFWLHEQVLRVCRNPPAACINPSALENAIVRHSEGPFIRGDIFERAALLMRAIAQEHPFTDGNKRLALAATQAFLLRNGQRLHMQPEQATRMVMVAVGGAIVWNIDRLLRQGSIECTPVDDLGDAWSQTLQEYAASLRTLGGCAKE